jgi:hypothetical protein
VIFMSILCGIKKILMVKQLVHIVTTMCQNVKYLLPRRRIRVTFYTYNRNEPEQFASVIQVFLSNCLW